MAPRKPKDTNPEDISPDEGPGLEQQDWDAVVAGELSPDSIPDNGDLRYDSEGEEEAALDSLEDDDDNAFQHSDEALPDDDEEAELQRHPTHERPRFGG